MFKKKKNGKNKLHDKYWDLFGGISQKEQAPIEEKLDYFYDELGLISDEFLKNLMSSFEKNLHQGDILSVFKNISSTLPGIFLTIPFFSTLRHLYRNRELINELNSRFGIDNNHGSKKILWFTDTINHMNGVTKTIKKIGWLSYLKGKNIQIIASFPESERIEDFPPNVINLPYFSEFNLPHYEHYVLRIPSILRSIEKLHQFDPDEIYISTPGPVGLFGLIIAKLLNTKSIGVFHTDFALQVRELYEDSSIDDLTESYMKWFYSLVDEIHVPTEEYSSVLLERGYDYSKMKLFRRGIDSHQFAPKVTGKNYIKEKFNIIDGITLMFAGRISRDKNIHFLLDVYDKIQKRYPKINLIIAGEGP